LSSARDAGAADKGARPATESGSEPYTVGLQPSGLHFAAAAETTVLAAASEARIALPRSCRNGTCRTCMCRLLSGTIAYRIEWPGLSAEEKAEGWILPCVAYAQSDLVLEVEPLAAPVPRGA
jgi:ferredoxin